jgi:serine/threonine-protein kinase
MGLSKEALARHVPTGEPDPPGDPSITDLGEPALVRATSLDIARGAVLAGRYQVEAIIGKGGSGIVLRAFDRVAQVPVAVKILKPELAADPHWVERFSRELRLGRQIQHANVCRIFDIGQADGHWFITMELASGGTLRDQLGEQAAKRTSEERLADVAAVVAGLAAIHEAGIVHRDVKPDNFLRMSDGRLVLSDFGLATNPADAPTVSIMVGTPHYMAPEVVMGEAATQRSDVWSLAVVIHEILVGKRPERVSISQFKAATDVKHLGRAERRILAWCTSCLGEDPEGRPENACAVERALERVADAGQRVRWRGARAQGAIWGAIALATVGLALVARRHMGHAALASSAAPKAVAIVTEGAPRDWSVGAELVASFEGRLHCFSLLPGKREARAIWGSPRRAEKIDLVTGTRELAGIAAEAYEAGCPETSPTGERMLITRVPGTGSPQILLATADGAGGQVLTNGTDPIWLPNGEEFLFSVDAAHVGVFSLPTMTYTLLPDAHGRHPQSKAVSEKGEEIAVLYTETADLDRAVDVLAFPDLTVVASFKVPFAIRDVTFHSGRLLLTDSARSSPLDRLDWRSGHARSTGFIPDEVVENVMRASDGTNLIVSSAKSSDIWIVTPGAASRQVTHDGRDFWASISPAGDMLIARKLADGRYVIVMQDANGGEQQLTEGPFDLLPSFSSDGKTWLYSDYQRKAIMRCDGRSCSELRRDNLLMAWPTPSPDGGKIAVVTQEGTPHLKVMDATGGRLKDLGPTAPECPPVWTSSSTLWAFAGAGDKREWREIDVTSGSRTGNAKAATGIGPDEANCDIEGEPAGSPFYRPARAVSHERWEVRRAGPLAELDTD